MKAYSQDLRDKVIFSYESNKYSKADLSNIYSIGYKTICTWISRYETTGDYSSRQGVGCGRNPRFTDKNSILKYLSAHPDADGVEIRDAVAPELPMSTFYDTLSRFKITFKKKSQSISSELK